VALSRNVISVCHRIRSAHPEVLAPPLPRRNVGCLTVFRGSGSDRSSRIGRKPKNSCRAYECLAQRTGRPSHLLSRAALLWRPRLLASHPFPLFWPAWPPAPNTISAALATSNAARRGLPLGWCPRLCRRARRCWCRATRSRARRRTKGWFQWPPRPHQTKCRRRNRPQSLLASASGFPWISARRLAVEGAGSRRRWSFETIGLHSRVPGASHEEFQPQCGTTCAIQGPVYDQRLTDNIRLEALVRTG